MWSLEIRKTRLAVLCLAGSMCLGVAQKLLAEDRVLELDPDNSKVSFTLADVLHTVHGTFRVESGTVRFDPATGAASGLIVVDAASGDSGSKSRDRKMNKDVLESSLYPEISFSPTKVIGTLAPQGKSQVQLQGIFRLHGAEHQMTVNVPVDIAGEQMTAQLHFIIPYQAWGLKNPSTLFLRVSNKVDIDLSMVGRVAVTSQQARKQ